jgi:hypothetical protein
MSFSHQDRVKERESLVKHKQKARPNQQQSFVQFVKLKIKIENVVTSH